MWELLCTILLASAITVSALPCCPGPNEITDVNDSIFCYQNTNHPIAIKNWCEDGFFIIGKDRPDLDGATYLENENKTKFNDGTGWSSEYCTGTLRGDPIEDMGSQLYGRMGQVFALLCPQKLKVETVENHFHLYAICILISCVFLLATLIVYIILPDLRDMQGKCVFCLVLSLLLGYLGLSYLQLSNTAMSLQHHGCVYGAFFTYFWMLSAFFWLNISSFNVWRSSVLAHIDVVEKKLMLKYYLAGFGVPFLLLLFALATHHLPGEHIRPRIGEESCWFPDVERWIYFYGIVMVLVILNVVYFISTALFLWSEYRRPSPIPRIRAMRTRFCVYFKLFMVMGVTWTFDILSAIANEPWYVTDIINCLQGVIIFLVMVIFRKRVWRGLAALHVCGDTQKLACCWERMEDEESDNEPIENTQMSSGI